mmetsp:Transcript_27825/g.59393  ORF Transcript_27825/g.59393 Transcript_27825/m.59393 type:complete len:169 (-) Transcript_27825:637-1143(-)
MREFYIENGECDDYDMCAPTYRPTKNPTRDPTFRPTKNPTKIPTNNPTKRPVATIVETTQPAKDPTSKPTNLPTYSPSDSPTTPSPTTCEERKWHFSPEINGCANTGDLDPDDELMFDTLQDCCAQEFGVENGECGNFILRMANAMIMTCALLLIGPQRILLVIRHLG